MKMNDFIPVVFCFVILISCDSKPLQMEGIYKMDSAAVKTQSSDTMYRNTNQLKIYTPDFMIYADVNDGDSVSRFGIGTYTINNDTLTEHVIFSANDSICNDQLQSFKLVIEKTAHNYKQFIYGMDQGDGSKFDLTEYYSDVTADGTTSLDGAWKQTSAYRLSGADTFHVKNNVQYKLFYNGYVVWGHCMKDSSNKAHTGVGYGKFKVIGDKQLKESMHTSTYSLVRGHDFDINLELIGTDRFKQIITNKDGTADVEFYERLKK